VVSAPDVEITDYRYQIRPKTLVIDYLQVFGDTDGLAAEPTKWITVTWALYGGRVLGHGNVGSLVEVTPFNIQSDRGWIEALIEKYRPTRAIRGVTEDPDRPSGG